MGRCAPSRSNTAGFSTRFYFSVFLFSQNNKTLATISTHARTALIGRTRKQRADLLEKEELTMLPKKYFNALTKSEISKLRGGRKHNFRYFVAISANLESDVFDEVIYAKLRNQMASQKTPLSRPEGYEPFQTVYGTVELCLSTMTIHVPRLVLATARDGAKQTYTRWERFPASVLNPPASTDRFEVLRREAAEFDVRHRIRLHAAKSPARLELMLNLMAFGRYSPISTNPAEALEAYLSLHEPRFLRDLLALLDMPEEDPQPSASVITRAA